MNGIDRKDRNARIGYWIARTHQGRGLVTAARRVLIDYAIGELGMHRLEIRCSPANTRSRAIPERLGFTLEGRIREAEWLYDHFEDHLVFGLLSDEWAKSAAVPTGRGRT